MMTFFIAFYKSYLFVTAKGQCLGYAPKQNLLCVGYAVMVQKNIIRTPFHKLLRLWILNDTVVQNSTVVSALLYN